MGTLDDIRARVQYFPRTFFIGNTLSFQAVGASWVVAFPGQAEAAWALAHAQHDITYVLGRLDEARTLLEQFVDTDPCQYDHHGYCQAHGVSKPCRVAAARAFLL